MVDSMPQLMLYSFLTRAHILESVEPFTEHIVVSVSVLSVSWSAGENENEFLPRLPQP